MSKNGEKIPIGKREKEEADDRARFKMKMYSKTVDFYVKSSHSKVII